MAEHAASLHYFLPCFHTAPLPYNPRSPSSFPFLLAVEQSTLLHIPFSYLADGPSTNAVNPLALRARSRPSIRLSFPSNPDYRTLPDYIAVQDYRRLHYFPSFPYLTHHHS